ncbi:MAG: hypothetical protein AAB131_06105, partial [Actinomycetota bacterium]
MPSFHTLTVVEELGSRPGLQRLLLNDHSRAFALTQLVGDINVGDEVVVHTTAVALGLGREQHRPENYQCYTEKS